MVGCSTYLRDKVGGHSGRQCTCRRFQTPSAPRFSWIAPGGAARQSCARRAQCADTATATSDGGPRRTVPLKIMRFARWASARQLNSDIWHQHLDPDDTCSCQGHTDRAEGAPAQRIRQGSVWPGSLGRQGRLSRSPQSLERIERFYDGRQAEPLLLDPGLHSTPLSRSLTLRERARLTGRRRPHQRLLQLGAIWAPSCAPPLVHSAR